VRGHDIFVLLTYVTQDFFSRKYECIAKYDILIAREKCYMRNQRKRIQYVYIYAVRKKYRQRKVSHPEDIAKGGRLCTEKLAKRVFRHAPLQNRRPGLLRWIWKKCI